MLEVLSCGDLHHLHEVLDVAVSHQWNYGSRRPSPVMLEDLLVGCIPGGRLSSSTAAGGYSSFIWCDGVAHPSSSLATVPFGAGAGADVNGSGEKAEAAALRLLLPQSCLTQAWQRRHAAATAFTCCGLHKEQPPQMVVQRCYHYPGEEPGNAPKFPPPPDDVLHKVKTFPKRDEKIKWSRIYRLGKFFLMGLGIGVGLHMAHVLSYKFFPVPSVEEYRELRAVIKEDEKRRKEEEKFKRKQEQKARRAARSERDGSLAMDSEEE